jgi:superfamily I DNA/RNA helicase/mRNA-degrading endonuclease RelE of RelBE toxin-antitoxin system
MPRLILRPNFTKDLDGLKRSARKIYQRASEILLELQRDMEPSATRRAESRVPKCHKYELPDGYRLVLQESDSGHALVALTVGTHDHVDSFLDGHKGYVFDEKSGRLRELRLGTAAETAVEMVPSADLQIEPSSDSDQSSVLVFEAFSDEMLRRIGVPDSHLQAVREVRDSNSLECMTLLQTIADIAPSTADALLSFATGNHTTRDAVLQIAKGDARLVQEFPEAAITRLSDASEEFLTFDDPADLQDILERGTLEQWQLFLHPDQRSLVQRSFSGPARVRGISGSGKTVIALHRARRLAKEALGKGEKVLFTTFDKGLAAAASRLLDLLCGPERSAIEVTHLHRWCLDFLAFRGVGSPKYSPEESRRLRRDAVAAIPTALQNSLRMLPPDYLWSEVDFLMGRFLHDQVDDYLTTDRSGRGRALTPEQRRAVLQVYSWFHKTLLSRGFVEPAEFVRMAYRQRLNGEQCLEDYCAIIVDEVQDISEIGLKLLHSLVGDRPDGLLLVGDTTQRIFTRGYSLRGLGIDIAGRGLVLRKNYRNTRQILQAAFPLVENEWKEDIAQSEISTDEARPEFSVREGCRPIVVRCSDEVTEGRFLTTEIAALLKYRHYGLRDICVLARNRRYRDLAVASLKAADIPVYPARDPDAGEVSPDQNAIRVSSLHGAKGHEFGSVFVIGVVDGVLPLRSAAESESLSSEAAVLYVGMTRARDLLYLSHSDVDGNGRPQPRSPFVELIAPWCDYAEYRPRGRSTSR